MTLNMTDQLNYVSVYSLEAIIILAKELKDKKHEKHEYINRDAHANDTEYYFISEKTRNRTSRIKHKF